MLLPQISPDTFLGFIRGEKRLVYNIGKLQNSLALVVMIYPSFFQWQHPGSSSGIIVLPLERR